MILKSERVKKTVLAALFIAIGLILPFFTGQIPQIGKMLSPMHIPVFLCGFVCGWQYGLIVGFITPLLRSMLFVMPVMFPTAIAMAFELAVYGAVTGVVYRLLPRKKLSSVYIALIIAMLAGRIVWGIASMVLYGMQGDSFTFEMFLAGAFIKAVPGIILHLILVPAVVIALEKTGLIRSGQ